IIGDDSVPWKEVIAASYEVGGADWFTVEQERYIKGKNDLECSEMSLVGLKKILKAMGKS
ncbi:MAG: sugar phosphate isomerase/epimerase, partial [Phycisphaerae bacterium]|nr:sugar phosphate isomerase/epimerase [Phycisphaerae bacterium]